MQKANVYHIPVLLKETIALLNIEPGKKFIDATLGGGGHSEEILKKGGCLFAIDWDQEAIEYASIRLNNIRRNPACPSPKVARENFENLDKVAEQFGFKKVDGILFDLGVSSHQLETPGRGFSFSKEGPLDMRMDERLSVSAKDLVNGLGEKELSELFSKLGEERQARRYAKAICFVRRDHPIATADELARIITLEAKSRGKFDRIHPATQVFQALRIAVNDELNNLRGVLPQTIDLLNPGGRLVILSFHSLEDGIVKRFFLEQEEKGILKIITQKPITPTADEVKANPRARSAKLRVAEKKLA